MKKSFISIALAGLLAFSSFSVFAAQSEPAPEDMVIAVEQAGELAVEAPAPLTAEPEIEMANPEDFISFDMTENAPLVIDESEGVIEETVEGAETDELVDDEILSDEGSVIIVGEDGADKSYEVSIRPNKTQFTYNGQVQKPTVTIYRTKDDKKVSTSNYTVTAPSSKAVGSYQLTITFKGDYKGTPSAYVPYTIVSGSTPKTGAAVNMVSAYKGGVDVYVKDIGADGYQVRWSKSSSMSSATTVNCNGTYCSIEPGKDVTIYIQARSYQLNGSSVNFSSWSSSKKAKTGRSYTKMSLSTSADPEGKSIFIRVTGGVKPYKVKVKGGKINETYYITADMKTNQLNVAAQEGSLKSGEYKITVTDDEDKKIEKTVDLDY